MVVSKGLVPPLGTLPAAFAAERSGARAIAVLGGPAHAAEMLEPGASVVVASLDRGFSRQLADVLTAAGLDVSTTTDVTGVELAGCAKNAAVLAAAAASGAGAEHRRGRRRKGVRRGRRARARPRRAPGDVRRPGRRRRPGGDGRRRRARATAEPASCSPRAYRRRRSAARSGRAPRPSNRSRCWPPRRARRGSTRRRSTVWPRCSRDGSSPSSGRRPSPSRPVRSDQRAIRAA